MHTSLPRLPSHFACRCLAFGFSPAGRSVSCLAEHLALLHWRCVCYSIPVYILWISYSEPSYLVRPVELALMSCFFVSGRGGEGRGGIFCQSLSLCRPLVSLAMYCGVQAIAHTSTGRTRVVAVFCFFFHRRGFLCVLLVLLNGVRVRCQRSTAGGHTERLRLSRFFFSPRMHTCFTLLSTAVAAML